MILPLSYHGGQKKLCCHVRYLGVHILSISNYKQMYKQYNFLKSQIQMCNFYAEKQIVLDSLPFFSTKIKRRKKISKKKEAQFFLLACCLGLPLHSRAPRPGHADALVRSVELQDMRQLATRNTPNSILSKPVSFILTKCIRCIGFKVSFLLCH